MRTKPYVGIKKDGTRELFQASAGPTEELYGQRYNAVIGPFRTVRGAKFMRDHGANNPHVQCVVQVRKYKERESVSVRQYSTCVDPLRDEQEYFAHLDAQKIEYRKVQA